MPTQEYLNSLKQGDLVHVVWRGGNKGNYRVEKSECGESYAVNAVYYNGDGTVKDEQSVGSLKWYNLLSDMSVESVEVI